MDPYNNWDNGATYYGDCSSYYSHHMAEAQSSGWAQNDTASYYYNHHHPMPHYNDPYALNYEGFKEYESHAQVLMHDYSYYNYGYVNSTQYDPAIATTMYCNNTELYQLDAAHSSAVNSMPENAYCTEKHPDSETFYAKTLESEMVIDNYCSKEYQVSSTPYEWPSNDKTGPDDEVILAQQDDAKSSENKRNRSNQPKPQVCPKCSKVFQRFSHLEVHMRIHNDDKPFFCKICARRFTQQSNLMRHMAVHKVWPILRRYSNLQPSRLFKFKALSSAIRKYKLTAPTVDNLDQARSGKSFTFECIFCKKTFDRISSVRTHMLQHKDRQLFHCLYPGCFATFRHLHVFMAHLDYAHMKYCNNDTGNADESEQMPLVYSCFRCDKQFPLLESLSLHYLANPEHQAYSGRKNFKSSAIEQRENSAIPLPMPPSLTGGPSLLETVEPASVPQQPNQLQSVRKSRRCRVCLRVFKYPSELRKHLVTAHPQSTALTLAHLKACGELQSTEELTPTDLVNLLTDNRNNKSTIPTEKFFQFRCELCQKGYVNQENFQNHVKLCQIQQNNRLRRKRFQQQVKHRQKLAESLPVEEEEEEDVACNQPQPEPVPTARTKSGRGVRKVDYSVFGPPKRNRKSISDE